MTVVVAFALIVAAVTMATGSGTVPTRLVTVQPGDTLWSIAAREVPDMDPAEAVLRLESLNELAGPAVRIGDVLRIPAR